MKKILLAIVFLVCHHLLFAQLPEDALRMSWTTPSGTAREQAVGGAMGSLGGDISSNFVNPAGLGFFKTREMVISPGLHFLNANNNFRGTNIKGPMASNFNIGTSGFVFGYPARGNNSAAFSIAVNSMANFNNDVHYSGLNDYSSFAEQFAEEFANSNYTINQALSSTDISYGTRMALYTYLIDTASINGVPQVITLPLNASLLNQDYHAISHGGITEISLGLASNLQDKIYIGASLGIPIVSYRRHLVYTETDATGNTNNDFASFTYTEDYSSKGFGLNAKLGMIYKPTNSWRLGLAIHTASIYGLTDNIHASMITNTEAYANTRSISSDSLDYYSNSTANPAQYNLHTPWRFLLSGSYLFGGGVEEVSKQQGFITADAEYVTVRSASYKSSDPTSVSDSYYSGVNDAIKNIYKGSFNFRLGGEMKFNTMMARLGFSYSTSPYAQTVLKANRMFVSGGVGYRNRGMFVDLTYVQQISKDINFPYRLADKANTYATQKFSGGTVLATIGMKF